MKRRSEGEIALERVNECEKAVEGEGENAVKKVSEGVKAKEGEGRE